MKRQLKPCPFCGSDAVIVALDKHKKYPYRVECSNIFCRIRTPRTTLPRYAVEKWNYRIINED